MAQHTNQARVNFLYAVLLGNKAEKQYRELEPKTLERVQELFKILESTPIPFRDYDLKKLKDEEDSYRIRLSSYRVLYRVFANEKIIRVTKIELRSDNTY